MRPYQSLRVLETLRNSFSVTLRRKGVILSNDDSQTTLDVYQQWLHLMIDLDYLHPESLIRDARRLWQDITKVDVLDLNNAFAECLSLTRHRQTKGFKALCSSISTHLYALLKDDIVRLEEGDTESAKRLIQLFSYTSRLTLSDIDLSQQCLDDYMAVEDRLTNLELPIEYVKQLNHTIKRWFGRFDPEPIIPGHGPGGVANEGRCSIEEKYMLLSSDQMLTYCFPDAIVVNEQNRGQLVRMSETLFVPKSYKTFRTISMEPATLMFYQQGVQRAIYNQVRRGPLNRYMGFEDQTRNQELARKASIDGYYATIDLSSASDSVSYELVKKVFKGTWLLKYLVALRSKWTLLPDGRIVELKKFAPMGSALCFPIETIIFAAICDNVTREHGVPGQYSVYGDDIILPADCGERLIEVLTLLGFVTNVSKSFISKDCWFRESCGGEFCWGVNVTPMKVSRKYNHRSDDIRFTALIALANSAYSLNFRHLRYFFIEKMRRLGIIPLFSPTSLLSDNYTNYHAKRRWNKNLQRIEVLTSKSVTSYSKKALHEQDEHIRYLHWLVSTAERTSLDADFQSVTCKPIAYVKETWQLKGPEPDDYREALTRQEG